MTTWECTRVPWIWGPYDHDNLTTGYVCKSDVNIIAIMVIIVIVLSVIPFMRR